MKKVRFEKINKINEILKRIFLNIFQHITKEYTGKKMIDNSKKDGKTYINLSNKISKFVSKER